MNASRSGIVALMFLLVTVAQASGAIYSPALPTIARELAATDGQAQISMSLFMLSFAMFPPVYGPLSDYLGRRKIVMVGMCVFMLGTLTCSVAHSIYILWLGRFIQGAGISCVSIISRTVLSDRFSGDALHRAISTVIVSRSVTPLIAPVLGGIIQHYLGWRYDFYFLLVYGGFCWLLLIGLLPETNTRMGVARATLDKPLRAVLTMLRTPRFVALVLCFASMLSAEMLYLMVSPFLMENGLHWTVIEYSWLPVFTVAGYFVGTRLAVAFKRRHWSTVKLLWVGSLTAFAASASMLVLKWLVGMTVWSIVAPMVVMMVGSGLCIGICNSEALSMFSEHAGIVSAVISTTTMSFSAALTSYVAHLHLQDHGPLSIVLLLLSSLSVMAAAIVARRP